MIQFVKKKASLLLEKMNFVRHPINRNDRVGMLYRAWGFVFTNFVKGAYYEFGLYQGTTFVESWQIYLKYVEWLQSMRFSKEPWRREVIKAYEDYLHDFYGFDSFGGMPSNMENNVTFPAGSFFCTQKMVEEKCKKSDMRYRLFKGIFSEVRDVLLEPLQPAAIVNIDSDLYLSARDALEKIKGKLQQGTILLMDDYNCFSANDQEGERRALKEFCNRHPQFAFEPWCSYHHVGQSFIVHLRQAYVGH